MRASYPDVPILALTATATERVRADVVAMLGMRGPPAVFVQDFNRPNLVCVRPLGAQSTSGGRPRCRVDRVCQACTRAVWGTTCWDSSVGVPPYAWVRGRYA